jgi:hypothetical protein
MGEKAKADSYLNRVQEIKDRRLKNFRELVSGDQ